MKSIFNLRPSYYGFPFAALLIFYSLLYYSVPGILNQDMSIVDSFYFSVVTITTLGYGHILPISDLGKLITASEAIIGIILLGLFLNALSRVRVETVRLKDIAKEKTRYKYKQLSRLNGFYNVLNPYIANYRKSVRELTNEAVDKEYNKDFKFSDMYQLYDSILTKSESYKKSEIEYYFQTLEKLNEEFRSMVKSIDLRQFKIIETEVLAFLNNSYSFDYSDYIISNKDNAAKIKEQIKDYEGEPSFITGDKSLIPYVALYEQVHSNMEILDKIETRIKELL